MGARLGLIVLALIAMIGLVFFVIAVILSPLVALVSSISYVEHKVAGPNPTEQATALAESNVIYYNYHKATLEPISDAEGLSWHSYYVYLGPNDKLTFDKIYVDHAGKYYVQIIVWEGVYTGLTPDYVISVNGNEVQTVTGKPHDFWYGANEVFPVQLRQGTNTITISVRNYHENCFIPDYYGDVSDNCSNDGIEALLVESQLVLWDPETDPS
jgi:hypothetical protein